MKIKVKVLLFALGILLIQMSNICVNVIFFKEHLQIMKLVGILLLLCNFILSIKNEKIKYYKILTIFFISVIGLLSLIKTGQIVFIEFLAVFLGAISLKFDSIIKYDFYIKIFIAFMIIGSHFLGLANSEFIIMRDGVLRESLGFYHPNTLAFFLTISYFEYLYLKKDDNGIFKIIIGVILSLIIYKITNSRACVLCILSLLIAILLVSKIAKLRQSKIMYYCTKHMYIILIVITMITSLTYNNGNKLMYTLNELLSNRIYIQNWYLQKYNISFFGTDISNSLKNMFTLDNGILKMLLYNGGFITIVYIYIYQNIIKKAYSKHDYIIYLVFLILMIYSFGEISAFYIHFNIFWLYFLQDGNKKEERKYEIINNNPNL